MSLTVNCFEGLNIEKCACPKFLCCKKNGSVTAPAAVTKGVVFFGAKDDEEQSEIQPFNVCVVQSPNRKLDNIGPTEDEEDDLSDWDTMLVDIKHRIVSLDGCRWPHLMHPIDNPRGHDLSVLRSTMRTVCEPLVGLALTGLTPQMHTICNGQNMTMFASPVYQDKKIIGVQLTYRPTLYTKDDVLRIITRCEDI